MMSQCIDILVYNPQKSPISKEFANVLLNASNVIIIPVNSTLPLQQYFVKLLILFSIFRKKC